MFLFVRDGRTFMLVFVTRAYVCACVRDARVRFCLFVTRAHVCLLVFVTRTMFVTSELFKSGFVFLFTHRRTVKLIKG